MAFVLVERTFDEPVDMDALTEQEKRFAWCLQTHGVTFLFSFVRIDEQQMVCVYEAPDADSVRQVQHTAGMPVSRVWTATTFGDVAAFVDRA